METVHVKFNREIKGKCVHRKAGEIVAVPPRQARDLELSKLAEIVQQPAEVPDDVAVDEVPTEIVEE